MKKAFCFLALLVSLSQSIAAQKTNTWKGSFPGQETNWHCPRNWSLGAAPDWSDHVVIPTLVSAGKNYPVLSAGNVEIYSLVIETGARLEIGTDAALHVEGVSAFGVPVRKDGTLVLRGVLETPQDRERSIARQE